VARRKPGLTRVTQSAVAAPSRDPIGRVAAWLAGLAGWRRLLAAAGCGVLASAAMPPLYLLPLLWPAFSGLIWLLDGARRHRQAFLVGWAFGFGHFLTGLYWVGIAFFVDAPRFGALAPVAVLALAGGLALFPAAAVLGVHLSRRRGVSRLFLLGAAWLVAEWLRAWVLTGFPWNLIGTVWSFSAEGLQFAALAGVWGLSLVTVLAAGAPALLSPAPGPRRGRLVVPLLLALGLPTALYLGGAARLALAPPAGAAAVPGVTLRLVQPSIDQAVKWLPERRRQHVLDQMALSTGPGFQGVTHVIWAETAVPYFIESDETLRTALARVVPPGGLLITGAPRQDENQRLRNSLQAIDAQGKVVASYDKVHLVPFGEYVPMRWLFDMSKLAAGRGDFVPGQDRGLLELPGLPPVSPLICYEVIYSGEVTPSDSRPRWLLTITNDAWFGTSSGPYQHFASARLRAVEEGLPMVRVANSGISGVVDAYGRVLSRLGLNEVGVLDSHLPAALERPTLYTVVRKWAVLILVLSALIISIFRGDQSKP